MFRITFNCEDRSLAKIMHGLAGQVYNLEVVPVAGSNPELTAINGAGRTTQLRRADIIEAGGAPQMLVKIMRQQKLTEVNAAKTKELCEQLGLAVTSYSHLLNSSVQLGFLKKAGKDPANANGLLWKLTDKAGDK